MNSTECNRVSHDSQQKLEQGFGAPMPWVGVYVAAASLLCTLAMAADVFHGIRHRKFWFPCKYFTLNAASLTVIAVAMKLPMDLTSPMPREVEQIAKINSSDFMCIIMANFMPSLGPMTCSDLLMNVTALGILVITIVVNVYIELSTGEIHIIPISAFLMFYMLALLTSSALMVPVSKKILQHRYLEKVKIVSAEESENNGRSCTVDKLIEDVHKYWIMAETSNPQFVMACSPTCSASGAICFLVAFYSLGYLYPSSGKHNCPPIQFEGESDYRWSVVPILAIQSIGVAVGTIAPLFRLFGAFSFKMSLKRSKKYIRVYQIENYWTQMLVDWKSSSIPIQIGGLNCQKVFYEFRNLTLKLLIGFQIFIVATSKIAQLMIMFVVIIFSECWSCCNWLTRKLRANHCGSPNPDGLDSEHHHSPMPDLRSYVLQLQDDVELANRTLKGMSKAVHKLIQEAQKKHPRNLMKLLERSTGFEGVAKFDSSQVPPMRSSHSPNSWSLVVVTLTSIVVALSNAKDGTNDFMLISVSEGLLLVRLVEESVYPTEGNLMNVGKVANNVWLQVKLYRRWMDTDLQNKALRGKNSVEILQWLGEKAQNILTRYQKSTFIGPADSSFLKVVAANSMYRISQSILLDHEGIEGQTDEQLFDKVTVMIADILIACLSNIQRVIAKKCDANAIGKREANVKAAARLVGQTKELMIFLQQRELPSLDTNKLGYIDEWHAFLNNQSPSAVISSSNNETVSSSSDQLLTIGIDH